MKTETFNFITKAIDSYGGWFFNFDDLFEDLDEGKDYYYYPTFRYCHVEDTKKTHAIMIKNETPLWLCCMQAIRNDPDNTNLDGILEDMRTLQKDNMSKNSIILY